jgi:hypothetical protein
MANCYKVLKIKAVEMSAFPLIENSTVPTSMPKLETAPSPAPLPNPSMSELLRGSERRSAKAGSGTARSVMNEYSDGFDAIRSQDLSGGMSRHSVDSLSTEEV